MGLLYGSELLQRIEAVCGRDTVDRLCAEFGGTEIIIPSEPRAGQRVCDVLGVQAVRLIAQEIGWGKLGIPLNASGRRAARASHVGQLTAAGKSAKDIARELGCTVRTVSRLRRRNREGGRAP